MENGRAGSGAQPPEPVGELCCGRGACSAGVTTGAELVPGAAPLCLCAAQAGGSWHHWVTSSCTHPPVPLQLYRAAVTEP